ncbi:hypothetical protein ACFX5E_07115 [Flavobacterium sp. LS2P90]|uniref:Uncharacterized protein n=1 Tax=Flavobacterium xylosi TaxID=3230415 RepID=A0ABW6HV55_9FLAO
MKLKVVLNKKNKGYVPCIHGIRHISKKVNAKNTLAIKISVAEFCKYFDNKLMNYVRHFCKGYLIRQALFTILTVVLQNSTRQIGNKIKKLFTNLTLQERNNSGY